MNHAFVDASWQEQPDGRGIGGWGLVLLTPGQLPARHQGQLDAPDNNAAELRAVLEAVRAAPAGEALTVHTDNQTVIACVARGRGLFCSPNSPRKCRRKPGNAASPCGRCTPPAPAATC
ncbi:ribonuclease HI [Deinococcus wulumuqiensis]|uniref:ribonuclease HI n=1 Tax=Deinococcus wulumuqiensis TaxID=980427 RepID=UPI0030B8E505